MMEYKRVLIWISYRAAIPLLMLFLITAASSAQNVPRFEDYPIPVYSGKIHQPRWICHADGEWRDNLGKLADPPKVNFAGKYFIAVHSCGTGCRYYTLTDLSSGLDLDLLRDFDAGEPAPKTRDGYPYVTDLITRANSKLLVAQYHVDLHGGEECRERSLYSMETRSRPSVRLVGPARGIKGLFIPIHRRTARAPAAMAAIINASIEKAFSFRAKNIVPNRRGGWRPKAFRVGTGLSIG